MKKDLPQNPFTVQTPEDITAQVVQDLWVDVFTDFAKIRSSGHSMLNGPRGCGKSMMFRHLEPDCQRIALDCTLGELPFFGILVSIKNTALYLTELERLHNRNASLFLNEHFLTMYVASRTFTALIKADVSAGKQSAAAIDRFYTKIFVPRLQQSGWNTKPPAMAHARTINAKLELMQSICDNLYTDVIRYVKDLAFDGNTRPHYAGPLCGYLDFLWPILEGIRELPFMPKGPIYLLMDDADNLNEIQTRVLNSWISTRTSLSVSIKVSTQLRYKTYLTTSGQAIDTPHDYSEVNISDIYTSSKGKYLRRVEAIVQKRLELCKLPEDPRVFFPPDKEQEAAIERIRKDLRDKFPTSGKGHRASDDVVRYARPMFITNLGGERKSTHSYSYAGFDQLVDISSGLIRYFLEPAARMFAEQIAMKADNKVTCIDPGIQNRIITEEAEKLMLRDEFDKMTDDRATTGGDVQVAASTSRKHRLRNLIEILGGIFRAKLVSDDAERRVFSIALSGLADPQLVSVFEMGVRFGYFQKSTIGNKDGTGRVPLYILTRRLAPYFRLDPTGFAGYLFVTSNVLLDAIENPEAFLRKVKKNGVDNAFADRQLNMFAGDV